MAQLDNGTINIELTRTKNAVTATLNASQYNLSAIENYEKMLSETHNALAGTITTATDEMLVVSYELSEVAKSVTETLKKATMLKRLELARKFHGIYQTINESSRFFIHPDNLFLISGELYIAHRGLTDEVEPKASDSDQFLRQYKALVISTLNPRYKFEELATGAVVIKEKAYAELFSATTLDDIDQFLSKQYFSLNQVFELTETSVKKSKYNTFKALTVTLILISLGLGFGLIMLLENTVPRQNRIIDAHAAFLVNNFGETVSILSNDEPRTLPTSVQYMLATSHVNLSTLTLAQRQAVLNNLSPMSNQNELVYWIYIGRGNIDEALNLAYIVGDNQLKLHAYAYRFDYINAHPTMPGVERQEALTRYRNRLDELATELGVQVEDLDITDPITPDASENYDNGYEGDDSDGE